MATLKTKQSKFKEISGKMDVGGAPIFNNDIIKLQQNSDADFVNSNEHYRRRLPALMYYNGPGNPLIKNFENGLILSGLTYFTVDASNSTINPGYFLSGGEVCYYAGGTFATPSAGTLICLKKGAASYTNRTFNDGISKQFAVIYSTVVETAALGAFGVTMPAGTTIISTDEVVVISLKNTGGSHFAERYFSKEAALLINELGDRAETLDYVQLSALAPYTGNVSMNTQRGAYLVSRYDVWSKINEIHGAVDVVGAAGDNINGLKLNSFNFGGLVSPNKIYFSVPYLVGTATGVAICSVSYNGTVNIKAPSNGPTPDTFTTTTTYFFDSKIMGAVPTAYNYNDAFLDVTP